MSNVVQEVYKEAKELMYKYFEENASNLIKVENKHCNKDNWLFAVKHSCRVEEYIKRIVEKTENLSQIDIITVRLAAIFHDIGNVVQRENHGLIGARIVGELFDDTQYISKCGVDKNRLIRIIRDHSNKGERTEVDGDTISLILKDADVLDQIGAMSILMHSNKYEYSSYEFYKNILNDLETKEIPFCKKQYSLLKTDEGKKIMKDKIEFINNFKNQLESEIIGEGL